MNFKFVGSTAACICLTLLASACGQTEDKDSAGSGITRAEFVRKADAICVETQEEFDRLFETDFPTTQSRLTAFFGKAVPIAEERVEGIRRLGAPGGDEAKIKALLAAGDKIVADFKASSEDTKKAQQIFQEQGGRNSQDFDKKAKAYGLKKCSEGEEEEGPDKLDPATFSAEKRAFVEKADAICKDTAEKGAAIEEEVLADAGFPPPLEVWAEFLPRMLEVDKSTVARIRALKAPSQDTATVKEMLDKRQQLLDDAEEAAKLAAVKDEEAFHEKLGKVFRAIDESDRALVEYGFQVCGPDAEGEGEEGAEG